MVAGEGGGDAGRIGQLSPYPPRCADLELMPNHVFVYIFQYISALCAPSV